jgi:hypothetical protein
MKGKGVVLKGHFHISTQELCDAVVEAESDRDIEEEAEDESESDIGDCIIVDVKRSTFE